MASNPISSRNTVPRRQNFRQNFQQPSTSLTTGRANVTNGVYDQLKCPVCSDIMQLPIYMCAAGHNICNACRCTRTNSRCPICNSPFSSQRNFALEQISATAVIPCLNKIHGCTFVCARDKIAQHVEFCQFQHYSCPMQKYNLGCSWKGNISIMLDHFEQAHSANMVLNPGAQVTFVNLDLTRNDRNIQLFIYGNLYFLYHIKIDVFSKTVGWTIQYVGSNLKADDWNYEIHIYNSNNPRRKITFVDSCISYSANADEVISSGRCAVAPLHVIKSYCSTNGDLTFKFFMKERVDRNFSSLM